DPAVAPDLFFGTRQLIVGERTHRRAPASAPSAEDLAKTAPTGLFGPHFGENAGTRRVDDVFGFVEQCGHVVAVLVEVDGLVGRRRRDERAMTPIDVDQTTLVF